MKSLLKKTKDLKVKILKRKELATIGGGGDDCYHQLDNVFSYCIITDGVPYGVWKNDNGLCIDKGASYCLA